MIQTYGDFTLASKTRINLPSHIFEGGPWVHLATVNRSLREYVALLHEPTQKVYIEEIGPTGQFYQIEDDELWVDLINFLFSKGVVGFNKDQEVVQGLDFDK